MPEINYNKILEKIVLEHPHNLEAIKELKELGATISFKTIMDSTIWNVEEKIDLIRLFGYNKEVQTDSNSIKLKIVNPIEKAIEQDNFTNFSALIQTFNEVDDYFDQERKDKFIQEIIELILKSKIDKEKYLLCLIKYLDEETLENSKTIILLINSNSLNVVKAIRKYMGGDINNFIGYAIHTNNIEIIKCLLEERDILLEKGPLPYSDTLLTAIIFGEQKIYEHLLKDKEKYLIKANFDQESVEKEKASLIDRALHHREKAENKKQLLDRINTIYETLSKKAKYTIDYTQLICLAASVNDTVLLKTYIEGEDSLFEDKLDVESFYDLILSSEVEIAVKEQLYLLCILRKPLENHKLNLIDKYLKINNNRLEQITPFLEFIFRKMTEKEKKENALIPYATNSAVVSRLLLEGFDIKGQNKEGNTLLHNLFKYDGLRIDDGKKDISFTIPEIENLVNLIDPSIKNKKGETALVPAIQNMPNFGFEENKEVKTSEHEKATVVLIEKMSETLVQEEQILKSINSRYQRRVEYVTFEDHIAYTLDTHREFYDALLKKGFQFDEPLLEHIYDAIDMKQYINRVMYQNYDAKKLRENIEFLFRFDKNKAIQKKNPEDLAHRIAAFITTNSLTNEIYKNYLIKCIKKLNEQVASCKLFATITIPKKSSPKKYKEFAEKEYGILYDRLDNCFFIILIKLFIRTKDLGFIEKVIRICTSFDKAYISKIDFKKDFPEIDENAWAEITGFSDFMRGNRDDYMEPKFFDPFKKRFVGSILQFAELLNNFELVKLLYRLGFPLISVENDKDYTWRYISSAEIEKYIEQQINKTRQSEGLTTEEAAMYFKLIGENQ